jgi:hypothetical protein
MTGDSLSREKSMSKESSEARILAFLAPSPRKPLDPSEIISIFSFSRVTPNSRQAFSIAMSMFFSSISSVFELMANSVCRLYHASFLLM